MKRTDDDTNDGKLASALRASAAEPARFEVVYETLAPRVLKFLVSRTFDPHAAADLTAETFAKAFEKRKQFRGTTDAEATSWVISIANRFRRTYERRGQVSNRALVRLGIEVPPLDDQTYADIAKGAELDSLRELIADALSRVPVDQRRAVELRVVDQLPYQEVARQLRTTEATARARVSRGLSTLRTMIGDFDMEAI